MAALTGKRWPVVGKKLVEEFPYIEAEVRYAVMEYARTATDVIARRTRLAFLNVQAADEALPRIVEIMAKELGWKKDTAKVGSSLVLSLSTLFMSDFICAAPFCGITFPVNIMT